MDHNSTEKRGTREIITSIFPPPESLFLSSTSVSISEGVRRFFSFGDSVKHDRVKAWGESPVPVLDESFQKNDEDVITNSLLVAKDKTNTSSVKVLIPEGEVYVFRLTLPKLSSKKEMSSAVELRLEESVPLPAADTLFEFDYVAAPSPEQVTLSVSAVSRAFVEKTLSLFDAAGLIPVEADTEGRCLARALTTKKDTDPVLIVSINPTDVVFVIAKDRKVLFSSTAPIGRDAFLKAIAKSLKISEEEAIALRLKKLKSGEEDTTNFFESIATVLSSVRDEMQKIIVYWNTHGVSKEGWKPISHAVISGSDACLPGVMHYLSSSVSVPVNLADVWVNALSVEEHMPEMTKPESLDYAALIGLLL